MAENACNFDAAATEDDGGCDFCSCAPEARPNVDYPLIVEASPAVAQVEQCTDSTSKCWMPLTDEWVFGNDQASLLIDTGWRLQQHVQQFMECLGHQPRSCPCFLIWQTTHMRPLGCLGQHPLRASRCCRSSPLWKTPPSHHPILPDSRRNQSDEHD